MNRELVNKLRATTKWGRDDTTLQQFLDELAEEAAAIARDYRARELHVDDVDLGLEYLNAITVLALEKK